MKKVEKLSLLFGIAVVTCGVVGTVSISTATTDEVEMATICGENGVTGELTLSAETEGGVCVEAGTQGVVLNLAGNFGVDEGDAIKIGKGAKVTLQGSGSITSVGSGAGIYNNGDLTVTGGVTVDHRGSEGYAVVNHGTMSLGRNVTVKQNGAGVAAVENGYGEESGYVASENEAEPLLVMNGGSYAGGEYAVNNGRGGVLIVNRGTFAGQAVAAIKNSGAATVNDGNFSGEYLVDGAEGSVVTVNDGNFEVKDVSLNGGEAKVNGGVYREGTAGLRVAVARGDSGKAVYRREDGKFILNEPIVLEPSDVRVKVGETVETVQGNYTYAVIDEGVATVNGSGVVTGRKVGQTRLTVTTRLAEYNERLGGYVPIARTVDVKVYQMIAGGSAKGENGAEVTIDFDEEFEAKANSEAHLEVTKVKEEELSGNVGTLLDRISNYKESYDISYLLEDGNKLPVAGQKMKIYLKLSDDLMTEDYKYYQVMYIKDDGSIGEVLHAQIEEAPNGEKRLAFETTHLSMYAVRASNKPFTNGNAALSAPMAGNGVTAEGESARDEVGSLVNAVALVGAVVMLGATVARTVKRG